MNPQQPRPYPPQQPPQQLFPSVSPQFLPQTPPPKKSRKGLFIALFVGVILIFAAAIVLLVAAKPKPQTDYGVSAQAVMSGVNTYATAHDGHYPTYAQLTASNGSFAKSSPALVSVLRNSTDASANANQPLTYTYICDDAVLVSYWIPSSAASLSLSATQNDKCGALD